MNKNIFGKVFLGQDSLRLSVFASLSQAPRLAEDSGEQYLEASCGAQGAPIDPNPESGAKEERDQV